MGTALSKPLYFSDTVKPSVSSVTVLENGNLKVKFSERYSAPAGARVYVDGVQVNTGGETLSDDTYNGYYTIPKANITAAFTGAGKTYENGKTYPVIVSGFKDFVGQTMEVYEGSFTSTVVADAPEVTSLIAKDETTLELTFSEEILGANKDGATNNAANIGLTSITKNNVALAASTATTTDGKKFTISLPTAANAIYDGTKKETSANLVVKLSGYKDLGNNLGEDVQKSVTVTKDTVKPSVSNVKYAFAAGPDNKITLTLSENTVAAAAALQGTAAGDNFYITDSDGVRYDVATADITNALTGTTDKDIVIDLDTVVGTPTANGTYTLHIAAGAFTDQGVNGGNDNAAQTIQYKVTGAAVDTAKPTAVVTAGANNGQITVTYNEAVKGGDVAASATNLANYKLNGAALPSGTTISLNPARLVATISLPAGYVETSGARTLKVSGVQDLAGNTIDTDTQAVVLVENKKPELTAAKVIDGELVLTFSENTAGFNGTTFTTPDFEVKVNGVDVTEAAGTLSASKVANNQLNISVTGTSLATGTITVEVLAASDITDVAGNASVKETKVTATR